MSDTKRAYTYAEAAEAYGVSLTRIKAAVHNNELEAKRTSPRRPTIHVDELDRWHKSLASA